MPLPTNWYHLNAMYADVSTPDRVRFLVPRDGYLRKVQTTLGGAITGADSIITVTINNAAALSPSITIANAASAEGDMDFADYFAPVAAGNWIEVITDGASSTAAQMGITLTLSG